MKNRIVAISLVVMLALSVGLIGCGSEEVPEITEYNLTISSTEGGSVTTPGEGTSTYDKGAVVDLVAEADEDWRFVNWTGDVGTVGNVESATTTITMDSHYSITANFARGIAIPFKNPGSFIQMTIGDPDSLDLAWGYDTASAEQVEYIYETLLFYDGTKTDTFVPVLAGNWTASVDGKTIRFKIRQGVKFHEGGDLTPSDVEYSFERAMVQDRSGGPIWMFFRPLLGLAGSRDGSGDIQVTFDQIDNAVEVDGDWIQFNLVTTYPTLPFYQILCGPWASIVDKEWCIAHGEWDGTEETWMDYNNPDKADSYLYNHTNGTGPWKLEEWDPGVQIKLVKNDNYWREPAPFERVITQIVQEWTTRKLALLAGDADLIYVPRDRIGELEGIEDLNVYQDLPQLGIDAVFFNMAIASNSTYIGSGTLDGNGIPTDFFSDINVRKGFNCAFDWASYIHEVMMDEGQQMGSPVIEGLAYYNPNSPKYSYNLTKAADYLKLAWNGTVWDKGFKFTLIYSASSTQRNTACEILAENLAKINAKFQVSVLPMQWSSTLEMINSRTVPMFHVGWMADYPDPDNFVVPFMASYGMFSHWQSYNNPHVDELIAEGETTLDSGTRQSIYYELQQIYYDDAPSIMLCQPLVRLFFTKYIHGFYFNPANFGFPGPLYYMSKSSS